MWVFLIIQLKLDRREPDDPCSYLLAIWTPGRIPPKHYKLLSKSWPVELNVILEDLTKRQQIMETFDICSLMKLCDMFYT